MIRFLPELKYLGPVGVIFLGSLLAYGSQILFFHLEPFQIELNEAVILNVLVASAWICYGRTCLTDAGRVPKSWKEACLEDQEGEKDGNMERKEESNGEARQSGKILRKSKRNWQTSKRGRWCSKCEAPKPPRAHHCRVCGRCIPKMDHHCPWTNNCASIRTFPHFIRYLLYAVVSISYLEYLLFLRDARVWENRKLPSYLGPSMPALIGLLIFSLINSLLLIPVAIIFVRALWGLATNVTTIESWEIERHETLLRRSRVLGGFLDAPDGTRIRIRRQEFPYDVGIWTNVKHGMCGGPLSWLWPFAASAPLDGGLDFEVNGFEDPSTSWPPPDPDRISRRPPRSADESTAFANGETDAEYVAAVRQRQAADLATASARHRRRRFADRYASASDAVDTVSGGTIRRGTRKGPAIEADQTSKEQHEECMSGEESWRNAEGERLHDFGVDVDVEFYDEEEDMPLAELMARRRMMGRRAGG